MLMDTIRCILQSKKFYILFIGLILSVLSTIHWLFSYEAIVKQQISVAELVAR
jgi:hypothetical protein